ncbi:MAG: response regulator, partial [Methylococcales bacterium]|nr:response regulator [Methylococcales bacterium]
MSIPDSVWIVDDDKSIRWVLEKAFQKASITTRSFPNAANLLDALSNDLPDALITDIRMPGMDGFQLLKKVQHKYPDLPVIVMTAHSDLDSAVSAFHGGAFEYLPKPFDINEVVEVVQRACLHSKQQSVQEQNEIGQIEDTPEIIGEASAMQ